MKKSKRVTLFVIYLISTISLIYLLAFVLFEPDWSIILVDFSLYITIFLYLISIQEFLHWAKIGKRSEMSDLIAIAFFFFVIFFFTKDLMTSLMGAFSIYLWAGLFELKDYPVINKILIISLVTYNVIFVAGLISFYLNDPIVINTTFAFSFWIILGLGFILFGRKYIVVWRFMSPAYLTLFLYIIAWLAVVFINQYTPLDFNQNTPLDIADLSISSLIFNIYFVLIAVNWVIYFISGPILDKMLGIKRVRNNEKILSLVDDVKKKLGIKSKVKVGFGNYPILNAMAYGSVLDKRIAIIAEDLNEIPEDELKGIVAHELAHTKGKHTLILTFITSLDLVIRMILGFPATYYDYTFGDPKIPMIAFIIINLVIYAFIYIFVRNLESRADLTSKKAGYEKELAKALYNLESFYATGREFGLNTMLLCEEKITQENKILDYIETAVYLQGSMIKPSRGSLLANIMNSHPPSYFRIAAILSEGNDTLKPRKEAILPFICLKASKQRKYALKFEKSRQKFSTIANEKFKGYFNIGEISSFFNSLKRKQLYKFDFEKDFIFTNKITSELIIGKLIDVKFTNDISQSDLLIIKDLKTGQIKELNAIYYKKKNIKLNGTYFIDHETHLILKDIDIEDNLKNANFVFVNDKGEKIVKSMKKTKLPISIEDILDLKNKDLFFKFKGKLEVVKCIEITPAETFSEYELSIQNSESTVSNFKLNELIIRPKSISFMISKNKTYRENELALLHWLIQNKPRTFVYLKKAVNSLEVGLINKLNIRDKNLKSEENDEEEYISIINIFNKEINIPYKTLEAIAFEHDTALIQKKAETSASSKLGYIIASKFKPDKIIY